MEGSWRVLDASGVLSLVQSFGELWTSRTPAARPRHGEEDLRGSGDGARLAAVWAQSGLSQGKGPKAVYT